MSSSVHTTDKIRLPTCRLPPAGLDVWCVPVPDVSADQLLADHPDCLSDEERQRLQSRRLPKGQLQFVFTRLALRYLLTAYHPAIAPGQWRIGKTASGRPHLAAAQSPLSFNLTHSNNCLVLAFSQIADPGVDIELQSRSTDIDAVAQRYFSVQECQELKDLPGDEKAALFLQFWTLKEAAVKASGLGLARGLQQFQFSRPGSALFTHQARTGDFRFWSTSYQGHIAAVALMLRPGEPPADIKPLTRRFDWPGAVVEIDPCWTASQSKNSSTNLEP